MRSHLKFYIDGQWIEPSGNRKFDVINPATEAIAGHISLGSRRAPARRRARTPTV